MLNAAVRALQKGEAVPDLTQPLEVVSEINLHEPALLTADYCSDINERLTLYKRMANCEAADELQAIQEELIDRFGRLPPQAQALLETHRLRIAARPLGISKIDAHEAKIQFSFIPNPPIEPMRVFELIQKNRHYKLAGPDKLILTVETRNLAERVGAVRDALKKLGGEGVTSASPTSSTAQK